MEDADGRVGVDGGEGLGKGLQVVAIVDGGAGNDDVPHVEQIERLVTARRY